MNQILLDAAERVFKRGGRRPIFLAGYADELGQEALGLLVRVMPAPHTVRDSTKEGHIHRSFALLLAAVALEDFT